jgi:hypothetical protein
MGFSAFPPKPTNESALATIDAWSKRGDAAIIHKSVPYNVLLTGVANATTYTNTVDLPLVNLYRSKGFKVAITIDVTDGLNRAAEAPELVQLRRSIVEAAVQQVYRDYVKSVASILKPDYLGLAAETNLIREQAPASVYNALVAMTNAAAADVRALGGTQPLLYASIQADLAWGPPPSAYRGAERDFQDFSFNQMLALSSYPYFVYSDPDQIPLDYFVRIANGRNLPVIVAEGGWTSASVGSVQSNPGTQAKYVRRLEKLADAAKAVAVFQLNYTDIDVAAYGAAITNPTVTLFASIGFADVNLGAKPALSMWDSVFARPLKR